MEIWEYKELTVQTYENPDVIINREAVTGWEVDGYETSKSKISSGRSITLVSKLRFKRRKP